MKDLGLMTSNMATEWRYGSMEAAMKATTTWGRKVEKESTCGGTEVTTMEIGWIIK